MSYTDMIDQLTLEQKCALLAGGTTFGSREIGKEGSDVHIPAILFSDGPNGLRHQSGAADHLGLSGSDPATCFPTASATASSWDEELAKEIGEALGEETAGQGVSVLLGPGFNMKRNPLCGRNFEYFSEDPYLAGKIAASMIRGVQSKGVSACPKHFAVNSQETRRMAANSVVDERTFHEIYLRAFEIAVKEGHPLSIMSSYNLINGVYANEDKELLIDILRKDWGFDQAVVTDWGGSNSHVEGVRNGSTIEMPAPGLGSARELIKAVNNGTLSEDDVNARVRELLTLIDKTYPAAAERPAYSEDEHHKTAEKAALECAVLLKNEDNILPLDPNKSVCLIGDFAETPRFQGSGSSVVNATKSDQLTEEIKKTNLTYTGFAKGFMRDGTKDDSLINEAKALAQKTDTVLLCLGLTESSESEGADRTTMKLEENQIDLLKAIASVNQNIVVLFVSGSPVELPFMDDVKGFLQCYLAGQGGASAFVKLITGEVNPSGKLAETWPVSCSDVPVQDYPVQETDVLYKEGPYIGYRYYDTVNKPVRFPFGYGLSYSTFNYENMQYANNAVSVDITNTSEVDGTEIVQIYASKENAEVFRPKKTLAGFGRVTLKAHETRTVIIDLDDRAFQYWNVDTNRFETEGGTWTLSAAASVEDVRDTVEIHIEGSSASNPYAEKRSALEPYYTGDILNVSMNSFEALLGHSYEKTEKKIDENTTFGDVCHGRSPIFWIVGKVIAALKKKSDNAEKPDLNILFIYNMPLRAMGKMTNGVVNMEVVKGLVLELKGFWIIGLLYALTALIVNAIQNKVMESRL